MTLHNKDIKDAKATGLQSTIDVLILASEDADIIVNGQRASVAGRGRGGQGIMPAEFEGASAATVSTRFAPLSPAAARW